MCKRILVPLDGSARAERAIPVADRLAPNAGGKVTLLRVAGPPSAFVPYSSADPWTTQKIIDADVAGAKEYLEDVTCLDALRGVQIETEVIVDTAVVTILSAAEPEHVDLLVLCRHGRSGIKGETICPTDQPITVDTGMPSSVAWLWVRPLARASLSASA